MIENTTLQSQSFKCDGCGLLTNNSSLLQERRKSFRTTKVKLCNVCIADSLKYAQRLNWGIFGITGAFVVLVGALRNDYTFTLIALYFLVALIVLSPVSVAIHELGHALVARAFNWQLSGVILGYGRLVWQGRLGDILLKVRFIQMGGLTWCSPKNNSHLLPVQALFIFAAGPAINVLAAYIGTLYFEPNEIGRGSGLAFMTPTGAWIFTNSFNAFSSLLPYKSSIAGVSAGSDGYQMLQSIFASSLLRKRYLYGRWIVRFSTLRQLSELQNARQAILQHLKDYPDDILGLQCWSAAEAELGKYEKATALAERGMSLLAEGRELHGAVLNGQLPQFRTILEAAFKSNLAYAILKSKVGYRHKALELATEAYNTLPWMRPIENTYGYAIALNGEADIGYQIIRRNMTKLRDEPIHVRREVMEMLTEVEKLRKTNGESCVFPGNEKVR